MITKKLVNANSVNEDAPKIVAKGVLTDDEKETFLILRGWVKVHTKLCKVRVSYNEENGEVKIDQDTDYIDTWVWSNPDTNQLMRLEEAYEHDQHKCDAS